MFSHLLFKEFWPVTTKKGKIPNLETILSAINAPGLKDKINIRFSLAKYPRERIEKELKRIEEKLDRKERGKELFSILAKVGEISTLSFEFDNLSLEEASSAVVKIEKVAGISHKEIFAVHSGNGLHIYMPTRDSLTLEDFTLFNSIYYDRMYKNLAKICDIKTKTGEVTHWDIKGLSSWNAMGRVPGTINEKRDKTTGLPIKKDVTAISIAKDEPQRDFSDIVSTILGKKIHVPSVVRAVKIQRVKDSEGVEGDVESLKTPIGNCDFIAHCAKNISQIREPERFNMFRILSNAENGKAVAKYIYSKHPEFNTATFDDKFDRSYQYRNISCGEVHRSFPGCVSCPHFKKIVRPSQLLADNKWAVSREVRFRNIKADGTRGEKVDIPALSQYLLESFSDGICTDAGRRELYLYFENKWSYLTSEILYADYILPITGQVGDVIDKFQRAIYKTLASAVISKSKEEIMGRQGHLYFQNFILDTKTGEKLSHCPELSSNWVIPYDYRDPTPEEMMEWYDFLFQVCGDGLEGESRTNVLQEHFGYVLGGEPPASYGKCLYLFGGSDNGKSTYASIIRSLLPGKLTATFNANALCSNTVPNIKDSLVAIDDDLSVSGNSSFLKDDGIFKKIITGDPVPMKKMRENIVDAVVRAKIMVLSNSLPTSSDKTQGYYKRLSFVLFPNTFTEGNSDIKNRIAKRCKFAILQWGIEGYKRLSEKRKFSQSCDQEALMGETKRRNDPVIDFLENNYYLDEEWHYYRQFGKAPSFLHENYPEVETVYGHYSRWSDRIGNRRKVNLNEFKRRVRHFCRDKDPRFLTSRIDPIEARQYRGDNGKHMKRKYYAWGLKEGEEDE